MEDLLHYRSTVHIRVLYEYRTADLAALCLLIYRMAADHADVIICVCCLYPSFLLCVLEEVGTTDRACIITVLKARSADKAAAALFCLALQVERTGQAFMQTTGYAFATITAVVLYLCLHPTPPLEGYPMVHLSVPLESVHLMNLATQDR